MTKMVKVKCRIPNMHTLNICNMNNKRDSLPQFLLHCVPHSLKNLYLFPSTDCFPIHLFCNELAEAVKGVTGEVWLKKWGMFESTFEAFFKAASQTRSIRLNYCLIDSSSKLDLDGWDYKWVIFKKRNKYIWTQIMITLNINLFHLDLPIGLCGNNC